MNLYEKIKEFTYINPASINIGTYLKDATNVYKIYCEMLSFDNNENIKDVQKREIELDKAMSDIINKWKI